MSCPPTPTEPLVEQADETTPRCGVPAYRGDVEESTGGDTQVEAATKKDRRRNWFARHKALTTLLVMATLLIAVVAGWLVWLNSQIDEVRRFEVDLGQAEERPPQGKGLDILLMGVDDLDGDREIGDSVYEMLEQGTWEPGIARSDTLMVMHLAADRKSAQLVSIPRDSWVQIPGHGKSKINAAFSWGGPELAARTVEHNMGIHLDHLMIIDFDGFKDLTSAIGGVDVFVPETLTDPRTGETDWERGTQHLEGENALHYVRTRYSLPGGDFDRIHRQQNFLRAVLDKLTSKGVLLNPVKVSKLAGTVAGLVTVDDALTNGKLRDLALDARHLRSNSFRFVTVPDEGTGMEGAASVVYVDLPAAKKMFDAIEKDEFESWYGDHEVNELPGSKQVK